VGRLNDEDILPANILAKLDPGFPVAELPNFRLPELKIEIGCYPLCQFWVRAAENKRGCCSMALMTDVSN
jgi:hypothetical protein